MALLVALKIILNYKYVPCKAVLQMNFYDGLSLKLFITPTTNENPKTNERIGTHTTESTKRQIRL